MAVNANLAADISEFESTHFQHTTHFHKYMLNLAGQYGVSTTDQNL